MGALATTAQILAWRVMEGGEDPKAFLRRISAKAADDAEKERYGEPRAVSPCQDWLEWDDLLEWAQVAAVELEQELGQQFDLLNNQVDHFTVSTRRNRWYQVFKDEDAATAYAVEQTVENIETEPDMWRREDGTSFLDAYIDMDRLRHELRNDVRDDNYWNESYPDYDSKIQELIDRSYLDEDPRYDSDDNEIELTPEIESMVDEKWEEMISAIAAEKLEDPIGWMEDIWGDEASKKAIEIAGIDAEAAARAAVAADGWQHFISSYDGLSHELPSGAIYVKG